jgi:hypothetical protein
MVIEANETHTLNFTGSINFSDLEDVLMNVGDVSTTNTTDSSSEETEIPTEETPDDNTDGTPNETEVTEGDTVEETTDDTSNDETNSSETTDENSNLDESATSDEEAETHDDNTDGTENETEDTEADIVEETTDDTSADETNSSETTDENSNSDENATTDEETESTPHVSHPGQKAILLLHGYGKDLESWVMESETNKTLPFHLAELGYDVWLGSSRGVTGYSKNTLIDQEQDPVNYWDITRDQMTLFDFFSMVTYAKRVS